MCWLSGRRIYLSHMTRTPEAQVRAEAMAPQWNQEPRLLPSFCSVTCYSWLQDDCCTLALLCRKEKKKEGQRVKGKWLLSLSLFLSKGQTFSETSLNYFCLVFIGQNGVTEPPLARRWLGKRELCRKWGQPSLSLRKVSVTLENDEKQMNHQNEDRNIKSAW